MDGRTDGRTIRVAWLSWTHRATGGASVGFDNWPSSEGSVPKHGRQDETRWHAPCCGGKAAFREGWGFVTSL